jgi:SmpA / OmlA family
MLLHRIFIMAWFSALLSLLGCDSQRIAELEEGVSTQADVLAKMGKPDNIWDTPPGAPAGTQVYEYNRQPEGTQNYMISIGPDGKMSALRQVLTPANFAKVYPGMKMEDVRKMLGKPMKVTPYKLAGTTHYDWRFMDPPTTVMVFTVVFDADLRVVSSSSARDDSADRRGG